jgi:uncharacterized protein (DUF2164 family)
MSKEQKEDVIRSIRKFFAEKLEIELSELQATFLVDYFSMRLLLSPTTRGWRTRRSTWFS